VTCQSPRDSYDGSRHAGFRAKRGNLGRQEARIASAITNQFVSWQIRLCIRVVAYWGHPDRQALNRKMIMLTI